MNHHHLDEYIINPGFPVYFSYAGNKYGSENDIEKDVENLRKLLENEHIDYRDYKVEGKSVFTYRRPHEDTEKEIGNGQLIVVVFSQKYIDVNYGLHCMHEWHCIVQNKDYKERIFPIFIKDKHDHVKDDLTDDLGFECIKKGYDKKKGKLYDSKYNEHHYLDELEEEFLVKTEQYKTDLEKIRLYAKNRAYSFSNLGEIVHQIKERIAILVPPAPEPKSSPQQSQISFIKSDNYKEPTNKTFLGRKNFTEDLRNRFSKGQNMLNVWGVGGVGKTSVAHIYIRDFKTEGNCYDKVLFLTSNNDLENDFCNEIENNCFTNPIDWATVFTVGEFQVQRLEHIVKILCKEPVPEGKKHLLVFDVNIVDIKRFENKRFFDILAKLCSHWHILILSRPKIKHSKVIQINLPSFEDDLDGAMGLFKNVYKKRSEPSRACAFSDDDLKWLFKSVYYHPLLIEQLAVFAVSPCIKPLPDLKKAVTLDDKRVFAKNQKIDEEGIILDNKDGDITTIYDYLKNLISFKSFEEHPQSLYIVKHFMLWPYEYIPFETIRQLLGGKYSDYELEYEGLNYLLDRVVLAANDKMEFRMHGALAMALLQDKDGDGVAFLDKFIQNGDYDNYIANIGRINKAKNITKQCIAKSLSQYFVADSNLSIYGDYDFWRVLGDKILPKDFNAYLENLKENFFASQNEDMTGVSELEYKVKLLNNLFENQSSQEIYNRVKTDYKDLSSHQVYYDWYRSQKKESKEIRSDGVVTFVGVDGKEHSFNMIRVDSGKYYVGQTQVTQELWKAVMGEESLKWKIEGDNYPVYGVSWYDCMDFIIKLNELSGYQFRLPTEVEWEFAARGGASSHGFLFSGSENIDEVAWYEKTAERLHPVAGLKPNELGIYDMSGNVWEWCQDWYGNEYDASDLNSSGPRSGAVRVLRGGSWYNLADYCCVSNRHYYAPYNRLVNSGVRLALSST